MSTTTQLLGGTRSLKIWGLLKATVALLVLLPAVGFAQADDGDPSLGGLPSAQPSKKVQMQTVYRMQGRNMIAVTVPVDSSFNESGAVGAPAKSKKFKAQAFGNDLAPVPAIPPKPKKFNAAPMISDAPLDSNSPLPPPAPVKFKSRVAAAGTNGANGANGADDSTPLPPPPAPVKFKSKVKSAGTDDLSQALPPPAPPSKFKSKVDSGSLDAPVPIAAPPVSPKMRARVDSSQVTPVVPDDSAPAPLPAPPAPVKFRARVGAAKVNTTAPADDSTPLPAPPVPTKLKTLVDSKSTNAPVDPGPAPLPPPPISPKFKAAAVVADQGQVVTPGASAPTTPLSKDAVVAAPSTCAAPLAPNSVDQANDLKTTLNDTLGAKIKEPIQDVWDDGDDVVDAHQLTTAGTHDQPPPKATIKGHLTPFVTKLLVAANNEAKEKCRWVEVRGHVERVCHVGSKRACLQGVRMAIEKSLGLPNTIWPGKHGRSWAKDAGPYLKKDGFSLAAKGQYTARNAPVGSVLIYDVPGSPNQAGHIEIKGQDGYYSDFYEKRPISEAMPGRRRLIEIWVPPTTDTDGKA